MIIRGRNFLALGFFSNLQYKIPIATLLACLNYSLNGDMETAEVIGILVIIDLITGVIKGIKRRNFTSLRLSNTGLKILLYFLLLVMAHQVVKLLLFPSWTDELIEGYIGAVEVYSILENAAILGIKPARKIAEKLNAKFDEVLKSDCK